MTLKYLHNLPLPLHLGSHVLVSSLFTPFNDNDGYLIAYLKNKEYSNYFKKMLSHTSLASLFKISIFLPTLFFHLNTNKYVIFYIFYYFFCTLHCLPPSLILRPKSSVISASYFHFCIPSTWHIVWP